MEPLDGKLKRVFVEYGDGIDEMASKNDIKKAIEWLIRNIEQESFNPLIHISKEPIEHTSRSGEKVIYVKEVKTLIKQAFPDIFKEEIKCRL